MVADKVRMAQKKVPAGRTKQGLKHKNDELNTIEDKAFLYSTFNFLLFFVHK